MDFDKPRLWIKQIDGSNLYYNYDSSSQRLPYYQGLTKQMPQCLCTSETMLIYISQHISALEWTTSYHRSLRYIDDLTDDVD